MHLFNVKQLFVRRRKYERVLGGEPPADQQYLDRVRGSPSTSREHHLHSNADESPRKAISDHNFPLSSSVAQEAGSSKHAMSKGLAASAPSSSPSTNTSWGLKMRPKVRMRKQKSSKLNVSSTSELDGRQPSQAAVQNFLEGPSQEEETYNQQCRDLLRKLSARANRVPGFM